MSQASERLHPLQALRALEIEPPQGLKFGWIMVDIYFQDGQLWK